MRCGTCDFELIHDEKHDAKFCIKCDEWSEEACPDPDCDLCRGRPEKPPIKLKNFIREKEASSLWIDDVALDYLEEEERLIIASAANLHVLAQKILQKHSK